MIQQLRGDISPLHHLDHFQEAIRHYLQVLLLTVQLLTLLFLIHEMLVLEVQNLHTSIWLTQALLMQQRISLLSIHLMVDQIGQHSLPINLLHQIAQNRPLLMFHMDKILDGDIKPQRLLILFQAVTQLGVQVLQLTVP